MRNSTFNSRLSSSTIRPERSRGWLYFVDDNFIGNRKAARDLLPHLIAWQKRNGYPFVFGCEATLNVAKRPEILELMREANFYGMFCGIETPEPEALKAIAKDHNLMVPILKSITTLNSYGIEVFAGIILGFDTDTPENWRTPRPADAQRRAGTRHTYRIRRRA